MNSVKDLELLFAKKCMVNDVRHIHILQRNIRKYLFLLYSLPIVKYNKSIINYKSIYDFDVSTKDKNDEKNKIRENIIGAIINKKIPEKYFKLSSKWKRLYDAIMNYISELIDFKEIYKLILIPKGGRKFNYDFQIIINDKSFNIEFKFNAKSVSEIPQFVSPSKPSEFMSASYEEYYYDNYLPKLAKFCNLEIPNKKDYLKQINSSSPKCMKSYKELYKNSQEFNTLAKELSKESIENFIIKHQLDVISLSNYLQKSQKDKIYMLYKNGKFYREDANINEYELDSYIKDKNRFIVTNKNNNKINVLLRWKNGNGIAFPAFQIS